MPAAQQLKPMHGGRRWGVLRHSGLRPRREQPQGVAPSARQGAAGGCIEAEAATDGPGHPAVSIRRV